MLSPRNRASFILLSISKPAWSQRKWTVWWWSRPTFQMAVKISWQKCNSCAIWKTMFAKFTPAARGWSSVAILTLRERNIGWRLDYVLASHSLAARASQCSVYREIGTSDHAPVVAVFDLDGATVETATREPR